MSMLCKSPTTHVIILMVCLTVVLVTGCGREAPSTTKAEAIYYGRSILTMEGDAPQYAEALAVKNGEVLFVGGKEEALTFRGEETRVVDLQGRALLPGFIDAHGHAWNAGFQKLADLVILDRDPLKIDPADIQDIRVLETIKEGVTVYK
jgi:predicted amidohydrolase YtcJ